MTDKLTQKQKDLIKKYEDKNFKKNKTMTKEKKKMYINQTDKNYKDGDRN